MANATIRQYYRGELYSAIYSALNSSISAETRKFLWDELRLLAEFGESYTLHELCGKLNRVNLLWKVQ